MWFSFHRIQPFLYSHLLVNRKTQTANSIFAVERRFYKWTLICFHWKELIYVCPLHVNGVHVMCCISLEAFLPTDSALFLNFQYKATTVFIYIQWIKRVVVRQTVHFFKSIQINAHLPSDKLTFTCDLLLYLNQTWFVLLNEAALHKDICIKIWFTLRIWSIMQSYRNSQCSPVSYFFCADRHSWQACDPASCNSWQTKGLNKCS